MAEKVVGIELVENSIKCARLSAEANGLSNVEFYSQSLADSIELVEEIKPDVVICNPPRRGLDKEVLEFINQSLPRILAYSSCNTKSLSWDLEELSKNYRILEQTSFDMFPLTGHVEVLLVLGLRCDFS